MTGGHEPTGPGPASRSPAHGFCDDEETRRRLRSRPPRQTLTWAATQLGGPVISARALRGGMSSAVHLLTVADGAGRRRRAVLRRYVRSELNAEEPDIAEPGSGWQPQLRDHEDMRSSSVRSRTGST